MTTTTKELTESEKQKIAGRLVENNIIHNVSHLVSEIAKKYEYCDDFYHLFSKDDWEEAAEEYIQCQMHPNDMYDYLEEQGIEHDETSDNLALVLENVQKNETYHDFCNDYNVDPHQTEIFEHWIVSGWLAEKLEAKGHVIEKDFFGLIIWGRPTTGQAILLDYDIQQIAIENMM